MTNVTGCIALVDPLTRLEVLKSYMEYWVRHYPRINIDFDGFFFRKYSRLIPGTPAHAKTLATHCYYCNRKFTAERSFKASVDHWLPQCQGNTEKYVICCVDCNGRKGCTPPDVLVSQMINAHLRGKQLWGYHGKKLKYIAKQVQTVANDVLYNRGPRVYYCKR